MQVRGTQLLCMALCSHIIGPNERRTISREYHGFYHAVVIGAVYNFAGSDFDIRSSQSFYGALTKCIDTYPTLSVLVRDMHTDAAFFERVRSIDLEDHIIIMDESHFPTSGATSETDVTTIETLLPAIMDRPWPASPPPWRVVVIPLPATAQAPNQKRCFIAFSFSHALGDGVSGLGFHRIFKQGIFDCITNKSSTVTTPTASFPPAFDIPENLPISWGFLLRPLIAVLLPNFLAEMLGLRPTTSAANPETWTATRMFYDPASFRTCLKLIEIPNQVVDNALRIARKNEAKLTSVLHQSIVRALSRAIPKGQATNFVSGTAVNMRRSVGISDNEMGLFVNAWYDIHHRDDTRAIPWPIETWRNAHSLTQKLAECAVTLGDQPIGLLRYVPSIRKWTAAKMGQERDCSYELSNLTTFQDIPVEDSAHAQSCTISNMVFSHSANTTSAPLTFCVVSVKGGNMVISVAWQPGALDIAPQSEIAFVNGLSAFIFEDLGRLSGV
jgi:hypothetical protein